MAEGGGRRRRSPAPHDRGFPARGRDLALPHAARLALRADLTRGAGDALALSGSANRPGCFVDRCSKDMRSPSGCRTTRPKGRARFQAKLRRGPKKGLVSDRIFGEYQRCQILIFPGLAGTPARLIGGFRVSGASFSNGATRRADSQGLRAFAADARNLACERLTLS